MDAKRKRIADKVFAKILKEIKPSKLEIQTHVAKTNEIMRRLKKVVPKNVKIMVVGSFSRGTNLTGDSDIDIFMLFDTKMKRDAIVKRGMEYAKKIVRKNKKEHYEIKYAEHPYVRLFLDDPDIRADIVPAFKIDDIEDMGTAVDRTPMHSKFLNSNLTEKQKDEVLLLKYLLRKHNIYGAQVKVKGFSGYLCELLVLSSGSLIKLLEDFADVKMPRCIKFEPKLKEKDEELVKKFNSNFVVVDPVDKNRNVAAGVSTESLARFSMLSREFIEKPDVKMFYGYGFSSLHANALLDNFVKTTNLDLFVIISKVPDKSEDILWPQLKKVAENLKEYAKKLGFEIFLTHQWINGKNGFILYLAPKKQLNFRLVKGPSALAKNFSEGFIKAHKNSVGFLMENDVILALEKNSYKNVHDILGDVVAGKIVTKHKDIDLKGARLIVNDIDRKISPDVHFELHSRLWI